MASCQTEEKLIATLDEEFKNPPASAKPRTWFHSMSGNMTKEGLTKDLEAIAEVGIGGLLLFNVTQGIPNGPIIYNSAKHHQMIHHAAKEAERLGLSFGVHNCDGWSSSGGPWVTPEESMKMVVWSETLTKGGSVELQLPEPSKREGFYEDIAVIAYPSLASEIDDHQNKPTITASDNTLKISLISNGKIDSESTLRKIGTEHPYVQFSYIQPKSVQSAKIIFNDRHTTATLQTSKDGKVFEDVRELFKVRTGKGEWAINDHFEPVTSTYFRLKFNQTTTLKDIELTANYYINNALGRTAIARTEDHQLDAIGTPKSAMILDPSRIKNLSNFMDKEGRLVTDLPDGNWTIMRFGNTSTGAFNNPASEEGRGLEVDKLNRKSFKNFFDGFVQKVIDSTKPIAPNALQYIEIDSYEMGGQNWTNDFDSIFEDQKGYDFINFLPLVAGRFMESAEASEAILSDYRKVISDLMTENYFAYFTELCNENGLQSYIEPYGFGPLNDLDIGGKTDLPMGEFWMNRPITQTASAVSGARIYGKPVISAESFTSNPGINWKGHPAMAKTSGDLAWTYGINEFMFHRYAHQANPNVAPGMTMNRWGFHFDRTQTWWKNAGAAWFTYIARGSHLLRQGVPVSDLLIYVGEGAPNSAYYRNDIAPAIPKTINFDNVNTDVLLNRLKIEDQKLVLPEGTSYQMLLLQNTKAVSLATATRMLEIAKSGVPVYGELPEKLAGYKISEKQMQSFTKVITELAPFVKKLTDWETVVESNAIVPDMAFLKGQTVDYTHRKTATEDIYFFFNPDTTQVQTFDVQFRIRNKIPELWSPMDGTIHKQGQFINEKTTTTTSIQLNPGESVFVVFREDVKEVDRAEKSMENLRLTLNTSNVLQAKAKNNGDYAVPLSSGETWNFSVTDIPKPLDISNDWEVSFQKDQGYGGTVQMHTLVDWSKHPKDSINYYSGTASYKKLFRLNKEQIIEGTNITLALGEVYTVAEVKINGKKVAVAWMPPFILTITDLVQVGENTVEILLTNQWSNRLIGEERYPPNDGGYQLGAHGATTISMPSWYINNEPRPKGQRTTFTTAAFYKKEDTLLPSGLLGPVGLLFSKTLSKY